MQMLRNCFNFVKILRYYKQAVCMKFRTFRVLVSKGWARMLYSVSLLILPAILPAQDVTFTPAKSDVGAIRLMYGVPAVSDNPVPLIVLNGKIVTVDETEARMVDFRKESESREKIGYLLKIAPEDIDSIRYLTDYSSTAIWGSRGNNGVIEVHTVKTKISEVGVDSLLAGRTCVYGPPAVDATPLSPAKQRWYRFKHKVRHLFGR